ncbi:MAG: response regulator transcription factor [Gemmatimonadetes bacterium]|nr:response regulator transcription factor [Gemmatimonadota bacterium]
MTLLRVLIVDDEPLARSHVQSLLSGRTDVTVIGECGDGASAVACIASEAPDLVLLDVQMPERDGLDVVRTVGPDRMPWTVFITAHDDYALEAFEVHAVDYVLKPVNRERFHRAIDRVARLHAERSTPATALRGLLGAFDEQRGPSGRLAVRAGDRVIYLKVADLDWVEAAGDNVRFHVGRQVYEQRATMASIEQRLPSASFARIHRSVIVNLDRIVEFQPWFQGDWIVVLGDGTRLQSGKSYRARLRALTAE